MLLELHVKNFALIERADLEFREGLTVISGETGAGKSILVDSINVALGAKTGKGIIRSGAEYAYIELVFAVDEPEKLDRIRKLEIAVEDDGILIVSRKITQTRSIAKINDETVTAAKLGRLTGLLLDMHGQFEHQSLLSQSSHLEFIDKLAPERLGELKRTVAQKFREYAGIVSILREESDRALREREADILRYEIEEIEHADLKTGEEEKLLEEFRRMNNASKIGTALAEASAALDTDVISTALRRVNEVAPYDRSLEDLCRQLGEIESLIYEAKHGVEKCINDFEYDEERFAEIENRLDIIHRLQDKYGDDIEKIVESLAEKTKRLEYLDDYDAKREELKKQKMRLEAGLNTLCSELTEIRRNTAEKLTERIVNELKDLNFPGVKFNIELTKLNSFTAGGTDAAGFMISTNPGQPVRPLKDVASGGELSRIMLALKTVLADTDEIETLIFDEIDAGISGKTAQRVAEKLRLIGSGHQVFCITHLPQIAAKADNHYVISKSTDGNSTRTEIRYIEGEESVAEIARMMSGNEITPTVLNAAREMKQA